MTKEEFAAMLDGREYPFSLTKDEQKTANVNRLLVVYGASDDLCELEGAINDEVGCYNGGEFFVGCDGTLLTEITDDDCDVLKKHCVYEDALERRKESIKVEAVWDGGEGYSWTYKTAAPHADFDILEDGEKYCRGIVIQL